MRTTTMAAAALLLAAAPAAYAQTQTTTPEAAQSQQQATSITKVDVVDITELPEQVQTRIADVAANSTEAEIQSLRESIDAHEMASAALEAEGIGSESVIAATMSPDGTLTLITRKS
jgi:uncharacterized lipoprotein YajG